MTTSANPLLENCCNPCCGDGGCNNKGAINIESTNPDCLRVDTSECGVIKLEPTCPKPTFVGAGTNITIKEVTPPSDCYMDGGECGIKGGREISATDEKVKACPDDTTPGTLSDKIEGGNGIIIDPIGCDGESDSKLRISIKENWKPKIDIPEIQVNPLSKLVNLTVSGDDGHTLTISDLDESTYDNMCCIGFEQNQDFTATLDSGGNAADISYMGENGHDWTIFTGNSKMATKQGIKIVADGYYRLFCQITVWNNIDDNFYLNLGRGFLKIKGDRFDASKQMLLSTAKHGAYARQILLEAGSGIDVTNQGEIKSGSGNGQTSNGLNGPWMTFNIDTLVDLKKGDIVTVGYRPQSNNKSSSSCSFRFVGQRDGSYNPALYDVLFGGTLLGVYQLAPKRFQDKSSNQVYEIIGNNS